MELEWQETVQLDKSLISNDYYMDSRYLTSNCNWTSCRTIQVVITAITIFSNAIDAYTAVLCSN